MLFADEALVLTQRAALVLNTINGRSGSLKSAIAGGKRFATCEPWTHPIGGEIRLEAAGEFQRSEAGRDGLALIDLAMGRGRPPFPRCLVCMGHGPRRGSYVT